MRRALIVLILSITMTSLAQQRGAPTIPRPPFGDGPFTFDSGAVQDTRRSRHERAVSSLGPRLPSRWIDPRNGARRPRSFDQGRHARTEIFSLGHRNSLGLAIHPETGLVWENENGPNGGDELNIVLAGKNYGWPVVRYGRDYSGPRVFEHAWKQGMVEPLGRFAQS